MTFTKLPNSLFDDGLLAELGHHELVLLLFLVRQTAGYHQDSCAPSVDELGDATGLRTTRVYEARRSLEERGLIEVTRTPGARCSYRVSLSRPATPPENRTPPEGRRAPEKRETPLRKTDRHPSGFPEKTPPENRGGPILKINVKKNSKERSSSSQLSLSPGDDDFLQSSEDALPPPAPRTIPLARLECPELLDRLLAIGVSEHKAREFCASRPATVEKVLAAAGHRTNIRDLAAWVVMEVERGGYAEPASLAEKRKRKESEARRLIERQAEAAQRYSATEREELAWAQLVAETPTELLEAAVAAARQRLPLPPRLLDDSLAALAARRFDQVVPIVRAEVREYLQARASPAG